MDYNNLLNSIIKISNHAGGKILDIYNSPNTSLQIEYKNDSSPLTIADKASNEVIVDGLKNLDCNIPILSEEEKNVEYKIRKNWDIFWLVDPLDGTKEFIKRNGEFTVNIALIENGAPIMGVVYAPVIPKLEEFLKGFEKYELIKMGSSMKMCLVADGTAHCYPRFGPTMEWDTGAAHAVVKYACGNIYNIETNKELNYNKENLLNPGFIVK